jgi:hypothetical protein
MTAAILYGTQKRRQHEGPVSNHHHFASVTQRLCRAGRASLRFWLVLGFLASLRAAEPFSDPSAGLLGNISRISKAQSRSISPENFTGEKGKGGMATEGTGKNSARDLGQGWKISPSVVIKAKSTFTVARIQGPGCIQQIWMTPTGNWRRSILRFYWDDETDPSVECPVGDFFACGWGKYCQINSLAVCVNPGSAFSCYWPMPFRKSARITLENTDDSDMVLYYQVNYTLSDLAKDAAYFHAQFRREASLRQKGLYTILDGVEGQGQYVGTYLAWEAHSPGWWGEGEIKFYLDGDKEFPTICGTGTEDYFCGSYDFENPETKKYQVFSTPYSGLAQVIPSDKIYETGQKFGLYRWHIADPVRFGKNLRVTIQALGWQSGRYLQLDAGIASTAFWYQKEPHKKFPPLPDLGLSEPKR